MADNPFAGLNTHKLGLLEDVFSDVLDRLRHYAGGEFGWDDTDESAFYAMYDQFRDAAKAEGCWWAR